MKTLLTTIFLLICANLAFASQQNPTRSELRQTVEHMIALAKDQQAQLVSAHTANANLANELTGAQTSLTNETAHSAALQTQIDTQTKALGDLQIQDKKDKADALKYKIEAHDNAKQRDVIIYLFAIIFACYMLNITSIGIEKLFPQYAILAKIAIFIAAFGVAYGFGRFVLAWAAHFIP